MTGEAATVVLILKTENYKGWSDSLYLGVIRADDLTERSVTAGAGQTPSTHDGPLLLASSSHISRLPSKIRETPCSEEESKESQDIFHVGNVSSGTAKADLNSAVLPFHLSGQRWDVSL